MANSNMQSGLQKSNGIVTSNEISWLDPVNWFTTGKPGNYEKCRVCPVIANYGRKIAYAFSDSDRSRLVEFVPRLIGTADAALELPRAEYLAWQAVRSFAPLCLLFYGLTDEARKLERFSGTLDEASQAILQAAYVVSAAYGSVHSRSIADCSSAPALADLATRLKSPRGPNGNCAWTGIRAGEAIATILRTPFSEVSIPEGAAWANAKITEMALSAIDGMLRINKKTPKYGVENSAIQQSRNGKTWSYVTLNEEQ
jgi:hypothetical protein